MTAESALLAPASQATPSKGVTPKASTASSHAATGFAAVIAGVIAGAATGTSAVTAATTATTTTGDATKPATAHDTHQKASPSDAGGLAASFAPPSTLLTAAGDAPATAAGKDAKTNTIIATNPDAAAQAAVQAAAQGTAQVPATTPTTSSGAVAPPSAGAPALQPQAVQKQTSKTPSNTPPSNSSPSNTPISKTMAPGQATPMQVAPSAHAQPTPSKLVGTAPATPAAEQQATPMPAGTASQTIAPSLTSRVSRDSGTVPATDGASPVVDATTTAPALTAPPVSVATPASASVPAAVPTSVPSSATFATQVSQPVFTLARSGDGTHTITVSVSPDNLGPVTVRAHVSGAEMRIELFSPSDGGRDALKQLMPDLRRDLASAGVNANLDLSSQGQPETQAGGSWREKPAEPGRPQVTVAEEATPMPVVPQRPSAIGSASTLDILV